MGGVTVPRRLAAACFLSSKRMIRSMWPVCSVAAFRLFETLEQRLSATQLFTWWDAKTDLSSHVSSLPCELDNCSERVRSSDFLSPTVASRRKSWKSVTFDRDTVDNLWKKQHVLNGAKAWNKFLKQFTGQRHGSDATRRDKSVLPRVASRSVNWALVARLCSDSLRWERERDSPLAELTIAMRPGRNFSEIHEFLTNFAEIALYERLWSLS